MASYSDISDYLLGTLCEGLGLRSQLANYSATQKFLLGDWAQREVPTSAPYPSLIGDDHSPFEYSVAFGGKGVELRLLFEVQAPAPDPLANQRAALAFTQRLAEHYGVSLGRFSAIQSLFMPESSAGDFSLWHGVRLSAGVPDLKIYLNPRVHGSERALSVISEALAQLGFGGAITTIERVVSSRNGRDVPNYFSLDISDGEAARVKVYFQHDQAAAQDIEKIFSLSPTHGAGDVVEFTRAMVEDEGILQGKPASSCFAFTQDSDQPSAVTYHLPIAHYVPSDAIAVERSAAYLRSLRRETDARRFSETVAAFSPRALDRGVGVQSYASFRRESSGVRFTAYLSPELFRESRCYRSHSRLRSSDPHASLQRAGAK